MQKLLGQRLLLSVRGFRDEGYPIGVLIVILRFEVYMKRPLISQTLSWFSEKRCSADSLHELFDVAVAVDDY